MFNYAILLFAAVLALPVHAETIRVCIDELPHPPIMLPDGSGDVGLRIQQAARDAGVALSFHPMPVLRCRAALAAGTMDAFPTTPHTPELSAVVVYPMRGDVPDAARATMRVQWIAYRRSGSAAQWDGQRFSALEAPVLVSFGSVAIIERMKAAGVEYDDMGRSLNTNFSKLLAGRGSLAVGFEQEGKLLLQQPRFAGRIERLPLPVGQTAYYFVVSKDFYARSPEVAERLWDEIVQGAPKPPKR